MHSPEVSWAPHFVGVQLVGASKLVSVVLGISARVQGISGLEAQFLVPSVLGGEVVSKEGDPCVFVHHRHCS